MKKLIIVDDSAVMRHALKAYLKVLNLDLVATAEDGVSAVKLCKQHKPDLITLDITMPEMDGIEALKLILADNPTIKVIIVSALTSKSIALQALKLGAKAFINKPIDHAKLKKTIKELIGE